LDKGEIAPVVVLSTSTAGLGLIRSLGIMGIPIIAVCYNKYDMGYVSKYVKKKVCSVHPEKQEKVFLNQLYQLANTNKKSILIPTDDQTLLTVSKNKDKLKKYFKVACNEWGITKRILNKVRTYELAETIGVPIPKTRLIQSTADLVKYIDNFEYPCVMRPCYSHRYHELFDRKMIQINNFSDLISEYKICSKYGQKVMLQEYIPGDDSHGANYCSYMVNGSAIAEFTANKVRLFPPVFGNPTVTLSRKIPEIVEPGRLLLKNLGFYGYSCIEFKKDARTGEYKLMEINGRINLSILNAINSRIDFPRILYNDLLTGETLNVYEFTSDIYWIDIIKDITSSLIYRKKFNNTVHFIKPYISKKNFAIFDLKDPMPFFKRIFDIIKMAFNRPLKKFK
jgi:predicted ATP-grasp superfamily ATP-dependent carboligase